MIDFSSYLKLQGYKEMTIHRFNNRINTFLTWCSKCRIKPLEATYLDITTYAKQLKKKGLANSTINKALIVISSYYDYTITCGLATNNPARDIRIKTAPRKNQYTILTDVELEALYHNYEIKGQDAYIKATALRNKVIVGLIAFQGLANVSLKALENEHLKLDKGKIYVPSTTKTNARHLELKSIQIRHLLAYQEQRPLLNQRIKVNQQKLFPLGNKTKFTGITSVILKQLKTHNAKINNTQQIRASVITNWLKSNNVRRVQFLAGHKRIMSTEFYKQEHIEKLQNSIDRFHPLG